MFRVAGAPEGCRFAGPNSNNVRQNKLTTPRYLPFAQRVITTDHNLFKVDELMPYSICNYFNYCPLVCFPHIGSIENAVRDGSPVACAYDIGKLMFDLKLNSNLISQTLTSPQLAWVPQALLLRRET